MPGFSSITGSESIMFVDNCSFDGTKRGGAMTTNGQLWIGSTLGTHVKVGTLTSPDGSVTIGYNSPNITLENGLGDGRFPITPYVVGPIGQAGYQTIQSAIDAADAAGGGLVFVQRGTYTEDLVFPAVGNIELFGDSEQATIIVGIHTPPTSGTLNINRCTFSSTTSIFSSAAAGTCAIIVEDCTLTATSGYAFDLLNWTSGGSIGLFNIFSNGANDGGIRNTGGASVFAFSVGLGGGGSNAMSLSGFFLITSSEFSCPISLVTGASGTFDYCEFSYTVTCSNDSICTFSYGRFNTAANPSLTMSSSGAVNLLHSIINSSNNPAITGAGAGTLTYSDIVFLSNASLDGTLTLANVAWRPYAQALAAEDATKVGTCNFDSSSFAVSSAGFVTLTGGGGFTWTDQSGTFTAAKNTGYFITGTATANLPASPAQGDTIKFFVDHASQVLTIDAASTHIIRISTSVSSAGGTATSTQQGDSIELTYRASDTCWCSIAGASGTWTLA